MIPILDDPNDDTPMPKVELYGTLICPYCHAAKRLLKAKGIAYTHHDVTFDPKGRRAMAERAGGRHTVPQIFIDGRPIGGCDELYALDARGELDAMLEATS